jgi:DNA-binding beta-propeller fold protein YncE
VTIPSTPKALYFLLLAVLVLPVDKIRANDPLHTAINGPCQMAADAAGNLYVNEVYGKRILFIDWKRNDVRVVAGNGKKCCFKENEEAWKVPVDDVYSLALDPHGNLYVGGRSATYGAFVRVIDHMTGRIKTFSAGREPVSPDGVPTYDADLSDPLGIVAFRNGSLFVSASKFYEIAELEENAVTFAGNGKKGFSGDGGPALDASLDWPASLTIDSGENLYVADVHNHRIRRINLRTKEVATVAGNGTPFPSGDGGSAIRAGIGDLLDIAADADGNLYLIESIAYTVRRVDARTGLISVVAGTSLEGYSGDRGPATKAQIDPCGIALDHTGDLYVSDKVHNRIRRIAASTGNITTVAGSGRPRRRTAN